VGPGFEGGVEGQIRGVWSWAVSESTAFLIEPLEAVFSIPSQPCVHDFNCKASRHVYSNGYNAEVDVVYKDLPSRFSYQQGLSADGFEIMQAGDAGGWTDILRSAGV
jgi:hypothetical protein